MRTNANARALQPSAAKSQRRWLACEVFGEVRGGLAEVGAEGYADADLGEGTVQDVACVIGAGGDGGASRGSVGVLGHHAVHDLSQIGAVGSVAAGYTDILSVGGEPCVAADVIGEACGICIWRGVSRRFVPDTAGLLHRL